jgi:crossover junction endodeoxyribonuclease RusA
VSSMVTVTLPLPPKELSPNSRCHYMAKANKKKAYREYACAAVLEAGGGGQRWPAAKVAITYYHKTKRHKDRDNIIAEMKAAIDGIEDSGLVDNDRDLTYLPVVRRTDKNEPRVELTITHTERTDNE